MADWNKYLEDHNANIFKDSVYRLMIVVNGYADAQGDGSESEEKPKILSFQKLSEQLQTKSLSK